MGPGQKPDDRFSHDVSRTCSFKTLASFSIRADWLMFYLVKNQKTGFLKTDILDDRTISYHLNGKSASGVYYNTLLALEFPNFRN